MPAPDRQRASSLRCGPRRLFPSAIRASNLLLDQDADGYHAMDQRGAPKRAASLGTRDDLRSGPTVVGLARGR